MTTPNEIAKACAEECWEISKSEIFVSKALTKIEQVFLRHLTPLVERAERAEAAVRDREAEILHLRTAENHAACELERLKAPGGALRELDALRQWAERAKNLAIQSVEAASENLHWAGYAGEHFQEKHDLAGDQALAARLQESLDALLAGYEKVRGG